jgi:hypothetical protein
LIVTLRSHLAEEREEETKKHKRSKETSATGGMKDHDVPEKVVSCHPSPGNVGTHGCIRE